jgi:protein-S-isoprenylcysteine O-methyltransferase Ste14
MEQNEADNAGVIAHPPFIYLVALAVGLALHFAMPVRFLPAGWVQVAIGLPLIAIGFSLAASGSRTMRRAGTPLSPREPSTALAVDGPFRFTRNPLYLSLTLFYVGIAVSLNALLTVLLVAPLLAFVTVGVIKREERYMERKFGQEYLDYKARVRRWI